MIVAVMAGGFGKRMGITDPMKPKMFMEIGGRPLISYTLDSLHGYDLLIVTRPELREALIPFLVGFDYDFLDREPTFRQSVSKASELSGDEFFLLCSHQPIPPDHLKSMEGLSLTGYRTNYNSDMIQMGETLAHMPYRISRDDVRRMEDDGFKHKFEHYIDLERHDLAPTHYLPEVDYEHGFERLKRFMEDLK